MKVVLALQWLASPFGKCVKESLVQQVGCKRPWDRESKNKMCTKKEQFTQFDNLYDQYMKMESDEVVSLTGCLKPCEYKEYKIINSNPKTATALTHVPDKEISFGLWAVSKYTEYEDEVLFLTIQQISNQYQVLFSHQLIILLSGAPLPVHLSAG